MNLFYFLYFYLTHWDTYCKHEQTIGLVTFNDIVGYITWSYESIRTIFIKENDLSALKLTQNSGGSRISQTGAPICNFVAKTNYLARLFAENCMKMKDIAFADSGKGANWLRVRCGWVLSSLVCKI